MYCNIDARFGLPPVVNLLVHYCLVWGWENEMQINNNIPMFLLVLAFSLLLLVVPIKIPLNFSVTTTPINLQSSGDMYLSGILGVVLVSSYLFKPLHFWLVYLISIFIIAPFYSRLVGLFKPCFQEIPTIVVAFVGNNNTPAPPDGDGAAGPPDQVQYGPRGDIEEGNTGQLYYGHA